MDIKQYHIGWICAILPELTAARLHLDEEHAFDYDRSPGDDNNYVFGSIDRHNIVVAALPKGEYGTNSAAIVARDMVRTFTQLKVMLMVGIGGGIPRYGDATRDIRLGDVVVSAPGEGFGGVRQYDFGKALTNGSFAHTGHLNQPPRLLLTAVTTLASDFEARGNDIDETVAQITRKPRLQRYRRPDQDLLFEAAFPHITGTTCKDCAAADRLVDRPAREDNSPEIHYGLIGSGNTLVKNAQVRDALGRDGILCVEMEAAGLMNNFPVLVIRGICDYADSHKNKDWQGYAAMTAAAYARRLLLRLPANKAAAERNVTDLDEVKQQLHHISETAETSARYALEQLNDLRIRDEKDVLKDIQRWFAAPDSTASYHEALDRRHAGTGKWLLSSEMLLKWRQSAESSTFCLTGGSGCGKTVLSSTIIEHLNDTRSIDEVVVYWHFAFDKKNQRTTSDMSRSLIQQICSQRQKARKTLRHLYDSCGIGSRPPTLKELLTCFLHMCKQAKTTMIVIDAVDEATKTSELISWLKEAAMPDTNRLFVTSRSSPDLMNHLQTLPKAILHSCQTDAINEDISAYVRAELKQRSSLHRWRHDELIQGEIEAQLLERSENMFRWVALQLEGLAQCYTVSALREHLRSMPSGLDATYKRMLINIPRQHVQEVLRTLQLLAYGRFELTLDEVVHAVAGNEQKLHDSEDLETICGGLVTIVTTEDDEGIVTNYVRLTHQSVQDFLLSKDCARMIKGRLDPDRAHSELAATCLSYMTAVDYKSASWTIDQPFYDYAATCWMFHYKSAVSKPSSLVEQALRLMDKRSTAYVFWTSWLRHDASVPGTWSKGCRCPLGIVIFNRLESLVEELFRRPRCNPTRCDAVTAATYLPQPKLVRRLLGSGYRTSDASLAVACASASIDLAQLYLSEGARPAAYMIHQACLKGNLQIVKLLLDTNIGFSDTAIRNAIVGQNVDVIELLLGLRHESYDCAKALKIAYQTGNVKVVELIMRADMKLASGDVFKECFTDAIFNTKNNLTRLLLSYVDKQFALSLGCSEGHAELVSCSLDAGAQMNQSHFLEAIKKRHDEVLSLLCRHTPSSEVDYERLLEFAAVHGDFHAVDLLSEHVERPFVSVVIAAVQNGRYKMASAVLQRLVPLTDNQVVLLGHQDIATLQQMLDNCPGARRAIFDAAINFKHEDLIARLIQHGGGYSQAEMDMALASMSFAIVKLLLDAGAKVNGNDGQQMVMAGDADVLHLLRIWGHSDEQLIDAAVSDDRLKDVDRILNAGTGPSSLHLSLAMCNSSLSMLQLLLQYGAVPDPTQLQEAAYIEQPEYMITLLTTCPSKDCVLEAHCILHAYPGTGTITMARQHLETYILDLICGTDSRVERILPVYEFFDDDQTEQSME